MPGHRIFSNTILSIFLLVLSLFMTAPCMAQPSTSGSTESNGANTATTTDLKPQATNQGINAESGSSDEDQKTTDAVSNNQDEEDQEEEDDDEDEEPDCD